MGEPGEVMTLLSSTTLAHFVIPSFLVMFVLTQRCKLNTTNHWMCNQFGHLVLAEDSYHFLSCLSLRYMAHADDTMLSRYSTTNQPMKPKQSPMVCTIIFGKWPAPNSTTETSDSYIIQLPYSMTTTKIVKSRIPIYRMRQDRCVLQSHWCRTTKPKKVVICLRPPVCKL